MEKRKLERKNKGNNQRKKEQGKTWKRRRKDKRNNKERQRGHERWKISYYHGKTGIIQTDVFVSGEINKICSLWSIYSQSRVHQGFTVT